LLRQDHIDLLGHRIRRLLRSHLPDEDLLGLGNDHGLDAKPIERFSRLTEDCPQKAAVRACDAVMPDLRGLGL